MSDRGLFGPDSLTWRVNREGALLLGGGRALLLQVAHPLVAAGVSQHSNYREDPFGRLYRTLDTVTTIVFGSASDAKAVAAREARAAGIHWTFAPMIDIARDPRWGRIVEGPGEDPLLAAAAAGAQVRGFQGENL